jgi:hypothetical protein
MQDQKDNAETQAKALSSESGSDSPTDLRKAIDGVGEVLRTGLDPLVTPSWFPHGITRISAEVKVASVDVSLTISGPDASENTGDSIRATRNIAVTNTVFDDTTYAIELVRQPPPMRYFAGAPTEGAQADQDKLQAGMSAQGAAKIFARKCDGGDVCNNNCAHFLSNAFIDAGFANLRDANACVTSRCATTAKRPIRARDMWCWFKSLAASSGGAVARNTGFWAVFQLDEAQYWGGHVVIIDSNAWKYYGTGWYDDWTQYSYQW